MSDLLNIVLNTVPQWYLLCQAVLSIGCFVLSEYFHDHSIVDRLWSMIPVFYAVIFAIQAGSNLRTAVPAFLIFVWGARLTYNFYRVSVVPLVVLADRVMFVERRI
jgi:steroid 5-alpha reductase family enzyme